MKKVSKTDKPFTFKPFEKIEHNLEKKKSTRDMRQEAIDMGSYGASEYFGENIENIGEKE